MIKTIRCKFVCQSITRTMSSKHTDAGWATVPLDTATMYVVTSGSEENKKFFASTPSGTLTVGLHDPEAFEVGKEYYVEISLADALS